MPSVPFTVWSAEGAEGRCYTGAAAAFPRRKALPRRSTGRERPVGASSRALRSLPGRTTRRSASDRPVGEDDASEGGIQEQGIQEGRRRARPLPPGAGPEHPGDKDASLRGGEVPESVGSPSRDPMGRSLDLCRPGPPSLTPLSRGPDPPNAASTRRDRPTSSHAPSFLLFCGTLLVLEAVGGASAGGAAAEAGGGGGGRAAASAALFLTAFATTIDPSWQLSCYTCVNVTDNQVCNRYAIDRPCPEDKQFCHSLHVLEGFGSKGDSLLVNKGCAGEDECNRGSVGCRREGGQTTCNACCDHEYCNEKAPVDAETATFVQTKSSGVRSLLSSRFPALLFAFGPFACLVLDGIRHFISET